MTVTAQDVEAARIFEPNYFAQFQPQTAADMVRRIPGFSVQGNEGGARGFGQASLNVLINGRRPSSKSSGANAILRRIPTANVIRIEMLDGASLDIPGLSGQVANIITNSSKLSGSWEYSMRFEEGTEPQLLEGQFSISGERGNLAYVASFDSGQFTFSEDGEEQFFNGSGTLIEDRIEDTYFAGNRPSLNLNLTWTPREDHIANLNLEGQLWNRRNGVREGFTAVTDEGTTGGSHAANGEDEYNYEIGGDYSFPAMDGTLKLIGLYRYEESDFNNLFLFYEADEIPLRSTFDRLDGETELIGRAEYNFKPAANHDLQISAEGAFNALDSETLFTATAEDDAADAVRVEEDRAETNLTHSWAVSDKFNLQSSVGVEYSKLEEVTQNDPAREFVRPKGFVSASYEASSTYTWRAKLEREVGQLNFGTFVSNVNLSEDFANSGNALIVPTQNWNGEIELERKDETALSGTLKAYVNFIEDPIDRIRFIDGSEGPGNLDNALRYGIEASGTWLLDGLGFKGGRLTLDTIVQDSRIDDPLTGERRQINDTLTLFYDATLRHDIPKTDYAWFVRVEKDRESPFFRLDQSFDAWRDRPELQIGIEHKNFFGMKLRITGQNLLNWQLQRERLIFDPDRTGDLSQRQFFSRQRGRRLSVTLSDTF